MVEEGSVNILCVMLAEEGTVDRHMLLFNKDNPLLDNRCTAPTVGVAAIILSCGFISFPS